MKRAQVRSGLRLARSAFAALALACAFGVLGAYSSSADSQWDQARQGGCAPEPAPAFSRNVLRISFANPSCESGVRFRIDCEAGLIRLLFASPASAPPSELAYSGGPAACRERGSEEALRAVSVIGSRGPDRLNVSRVRTPYLGPHSHIEGLLGDDVIEGTATPDKIISGPGGEGRDDRDVVLGFAGDDIIVSGRGKDIVRGGRSHDVLRGGSANDRLFGEQDRDALFGNSGHDLLVGGPGRDRFPDARGRQPNH